MTSPLAGLKESAEHIAKRMAAKSKTVANRSPEKYAAVLRAQSEAHLGYKMPESQKKNIAAALKGKQNCLGHKPSIEHRRKLSAYWLANRERHNHYIDGKGGERSSARIVDMGRIEYRLWRESVFKRDDWTCVLCDDRGVKIHADHIKPYAQYPELRYVVSNGRTLCVPCHLKQPTHGNGAKFRREIQPQQMEL